MKMYVFVFLSTILVAVEQSAKFDGPCTIKITQIQTFDHQRYSRNCVLVAVGQSAKIDGPCPIKIKQIETFDPNRYLGKWWDVYANSYDVCSSGYGCILTYYRDYDENLHAIDVNYYFGPDYANICSFGIWQTDSDVDPGLFYDGDKNSIYVLDTDYDSYAVEIACSNDDGTTHEERVVLRSRNFVMSDEVRDRLVKKVVDYGFAEPNLNAHNYTGCKDFTPDF